MCLNENLLHKNISNCYLLEKSGVLQTTITDICSGKNRIEKYPIETLHKIANALDISMKSLIG